MSVGIILVVAIAASECSNDLEARDRKCIISATLMDEQSFAGITAVSDVNLALRKYWKMEVEGDPPAGGLRRKLSRYLFKQPSRVQYSKLE